MPRVTGKGSLFQLDKNVPAKKCRRWRISIPYGKDQATGKYRRYTKVFHGTKTEAQKERQRLIAEIDSGIDTKAGEMTFLAFANSWLEERSALGQIRETTLYRYSHAVKVICSYIGIESLSNINSVTVSKVYVSLSKAYSQTTANSIAVVFASIMKAAYTRRLIQFNPCNAVSLPKKYTPEREALSQEQAQAIADYIETNLDGETIAISLMLLCGLRASEAIAITWGDIDLKAGYVFVNKQLSRKNEFVDVKTKQAIRSIPMPSNLKQMLEKYNSITYSDLKKKGIIEAREDLSGILLAYNESDISCMYNKVMRRFHAICKELNIEGFTLHSLRHTYATQLIAAGTDTITAIRLMGHKDSKMLERIYAHLVPDNVERAALAIESYYKKANY